MGTAVLYPVDPRPRVAPERSEGGSAVKNAHFEISKRLNNKLPNEPISESQINPLHQPLRKNSCKLHPKTNPFSGCWKMVWNLEFGIWNFSRRAQSC
jgi:hypothetical protein